MKNLAMLVVVLGLCGAGAVAAPVLTVDNPMYVITVQSGSLVSHSFVLSNAGDETLSITSVRTSCGCTTAALAKRDLAPGESVSVDAVVNTTGFRGTVTRTITVSSNDPAHPVTTLRIDVTIADVVPEVPAISPADLKLVFFLLIDVRTADEYASGHLFGAVNIPLAEIAADPGLWAARLPQDLPIILYGADGEAGRAAGAAMLAAGLPNVLQLEGGLAGWDAAFGDGALYAP